MSKKVERFVFRSGNRACEICGEKRILVCHHIHGRNILGWDKNWNKCWICPNCHDEIHSGCIIVEDWGLTTDGYVLFWHKQGEDPKAFKGATPNLYSYKR